MLQKKGKSVIIFALFFGILFSKNVFADSKIEAKVSSTIILKVNDKELKNLDMPPVIFNNSTLVPAREVFEELQAKVQWEPENKRIFVSYDKSIVMLEIGNKFAGVDGSLFEMNIPPQIINGKTMIPLRFVGETLGFEVEWDPVKRIAGVAQRNTLQQMPDLDETKVPVQVEEIITKPTEEVKPKEEEIIVSTVKAVDISPNEIPVQDTPETKIINISSDANGISITATSAMGKIEKGLLEDNRLIIDIYNAENTILTEQNTTHPSITSLKIAQNQIDPIKITRVVMTLNGGVEYSVGISEDRKTLNINFKKNAITNVSFVSEEDMDLIHLDFSETPIVNTYAISSPNRIVIESANTELKSAIQNNKTGVYFSDSSMKEENGTSRIYLNLKDIAMATTEINAKRATIKIQKPTYKNLIFNGDTNTLTISKNSQAISGNIVAKDNYNELKYVFNLQGDFKNSIGFGEYLIGDEAISSVNIKNNNLGQTELVFNENRVFSFNITEDANGIYIKAINPREVYNKIIVVDAGHGGVDRGTFYHNIAEKDMVFDMANKLANLIEKDESMKVYVTRNTDVKIELEDRVKFSNGLADIFISIHCNSATNPAPSGTETYYYPHDNDTALGLSSKQLADVMQNDLVKNLSSFDRKVKESKFYVIAYTQMPAVLIEVGFLSNQVEASRINTDAYRQSVADSIYGSLQTIFQTYTPAR